MKNNIFISSMMVTAITIFSKFLGLLKQTIIASTCGATIETDAFYIATGVIGQLAIAIFSAISISLLSIYTKKRTENGAEESSRLINCVLMYFMPISFFITAVIYFFSVPIAHLLAPKYSSNEVIILAKYIRIMSFAFIPWCYYLIINVILEGNKKFLPGRCQALFQNIFLIIATITLYKKYGISILVYSFLFSGIAEGILVTWCARKYIILSLKKCNYKNEIKKLIVISIPLILGNAVYEINDIVDKQIATIIGEGYASILTYGSTINDIVARSNCFINISGFICKFCHTCCRKKV